MMKKVQLMIVVVLVFCISLQVVSAFPNNSVRRSNHSYAKTDWSVSMVESTMKRYPTADSLKGWGYAKSLYLCGVYLVYLRTRDKRYLDHVQSWIDLHIDDQGTINRPINALDYMLPGNLLLILYKQTKQEKYKLAAITSEKSSTLIRAPKTAGSGTPIHQAGSGNYGPTASSCRCHFWFVMGRCSATARMQMMKSRNNC